MVLSGENHLQLYIPKGFAHGFVVRSETADFLYKCSDYFDAADDRGVLWNDPGDRHRLADGIDPLLSAKDQRYLPLSKSRTISFRDTNDEAAADHPGRPRTGGLALATDPGPLGEVLALSRDTLNLFDLDAVVAIRDARPDVVVNAAAYTAVDQAESEPELGARGQRLAPARPSPTNWCAAAAADSLLHRLRFRRQQGPPYVETDPTAPLGVYGRTKLEGEQMIAASGCAHVILRTMGLRHARQELFAHRASPGAREGRTAHRRRPDRGSHVGVHLADATAVIVAGSLSQRATNIWPNNGIFHLTAGGSTTWAGFAAAIVDEYRSLHHAAQEELQRVLESIERQAQRRIQPAHTRAAGNGDYYRGISTPATRPRYSVLSNAKGRAAFGVAMPEWREQLRLALSAAVRG